MLLTFVVCNTLTTMMETPLPSTSRACIRCLAKNIKVRLAGIDTPEVRTKDKCEKVAGKVAKQIVATLLRKAKRIDLEDVRRGQIFSHCC